MRVPPLFADFPSDVTITRESVSAFAFFVAECYSSPSLQPIDLECSHFVSLSASISQIEFINSPSSPYILLRSAEF